MSKNNVKDPLISIVILNYNAGELLFNCVNSITKLDYSNYEIILVDNNSTDQSHIECKKKFDQVRLIENKENSGYCEGNNIGIRNAKGEYILVLNPDTKIESNLLNEFLKAYEKFGEGLYQPKILAFEGNLIESAGNMIQLFGFGYSKGRGIKDNGEYEKPQEIGFASGACLFTKMDVIKKIGLLDPFIFLYLDDLDLGWRAKHIGIKSFYVPSTTIYHVRSYYYKWNKMKFFWLERNRHYCLLTHISKKTFCKMIPSLIIIEIMMIIFYGVKGFGKMKLKAYADILKNMNHINEKYNELNQKRIVSDKEILKNYSNEIFIPNDISSDFNNKIFNKIIAFLSQCTKKII